MYVRVLRVTKTVFNLKYLTWKQEMATWSHLEVLAHHNFLSPKSRLSQYSIISKLHWFNICSTISIGANGIALTELQSAS